MTKIFHQMDRYERLLRKLIINIFESAIEWQIDGM